MTRALLVLAFLFCLPATRAVADEPLPDALRAKLEAMAPILKPVVYIPAAGGQPARWLAFIGPGTAFSAWFVTPGAGDHELAKVEDWPPGVRVVGATVGTLPDSMPGDKGARNVFVVVETPAVPELDQPAGLRSVVILPIGDPRNVNYVGDRGEDLPFFAGVKDETEVRARLDADGHQWAEDTADKILADDQRNGTIFDAARKSDAALAALIPDDGILVFEVQRQLFGREVGRIRKLDTSPAVAALRKGIADAPSWNGHQTGVLVVGAEHGHPVIRTLLTTPSPGASARHPRQLVAANAGDTQTGATARALGFIPVRVLGEAALRNGVGTIGVIDTGQSLLIIARDGDYALAWETMGITGMKDAPLFADFDGDGQTDVLMHGDSGPIFDLGVDGRESVVIQGLQLASLGKTKLPDIARAALTIEDGPVSATEACALLTGAKTPALLEKILAPGAEVYTWEEPEQPGWGKRTVLSGKKRVTELRANFRDPCGVTCDPHLPVCEDRWQPPGVDYYLFTHKDGKPRLLKASLYRGS